MNSKYGATEISLPESCQVVRKWNKLDKAGQLAHVQCNIVQCNRQRLEIGIGLGKEVDPETYSTDH